jgi:hypothetical protein
VKPRLSPAAMLLGASAVVLMGLVMVVYGLLQLVGALIAALVWVWDSIRGRS